MKQAFPPHRRALAALVPTLAVLAVPALAQDQQATPVAPPPVVSTAPAPAPAPVQATPAPAQAAPVQTVQPAPVEALPPPDVTPERAAPRATRVPTATRSTIQRTTTTTRAAPAPVAAPAASTSAPAPAPVAAAPETTPVVTPAPAEQASTQSTQTTTTTPAPANAGFNWASPWLALLGIGIIALVGFLFAARRRRADVYESYDEPVAYEEPVREPAPFVPEPVVAAAPIARPDAQFLRRETPRAAVEAPVVADEQLAAPVVGTGELVEPSHDDIEALTAGHPPVADRPWLEMAMRPVRAGTNVDEALVEIELTVGNSGSGAADDVRISTFMFANAPAADEMERLLVERDAEAAPAARIKPGEGTTLEATLALPRASLNGAVSPVIVADARYPLPGGGEGHTAASFRISVSDDGETMTPIPTDRAHMFDEVTAELEGVPERA